MTCRQAGGGVRSQLSAGRAGSKPGAAWDILGPHLLMVELSFCGAPGKGHRDGGPRKE